MKIVSASGTQGPPASLELAVIVGDTMTIERLPPEGSLMIGRGGGCDIRIANGSVSRQHAILHLGPPLRLEDLGSSNGTSVDDPAAPASLRTRPLRRLSKEVVEIAVGVRFHVGSTTVVVRQGMHREASHGTPVGPQEDRDGPIIRAPSMRALYDQARRASQGSSKILILGETGTGKEVLARAIHRFSPRHRGPYLELSCAALSPSLVEGELFGSEKGAYTGAQARPGLLEAASGGTLFLDEVGELPEPIQVKLLRVLEDGKVLRVGARAHRLVDVRFIAATNRDLEKEVREGRFRQDLFFRLNGFALTIPPLRERLPEIEPLAEMFLARASRELDRSAVPRISPEVLDALRRHRWPGNVRELRNVIERAVVLCTGDVLLREELPSALAGTSGQGQDTASDSAASLAERAHAAAKAAERERIVQALAESGGNQKRAAAILQMSLRSLIYKLDEHGLPRPRKHSTGG